MFVDVGFVCYGRVCLFVRSKESRVRHDSCPLGSHKLLLVVVLSKTSFCKSVFFFLGVSIHPEYAVLSFFLSFFLFFFLSSSLSLFFLSLLACALRVMLIKHQTRRSGLLILENILKTNKGTTDEQSFDEKEKKKKRKRTDIDTRDFLEGGC